MKAEIMQASPHTPTITASVKVNTQTSNTPILLRALNWLVARDRRYRDIQKFRRMPSERLLDMGLTRQQANQAFYRAGRERTDTELFIAPLSTRMKSR